MGTKIGELRESLMDAIDMVKRGKLNPEDAQAISKLAGEISRSLQVEASIRAQGMTGEKLPLGELVIGEQPITLENNASKKLAAPGKDAAEAPGTNKPDPLPPVS